MPNDSVTINRDRLLDRFLRYVRVGTSADPHSDSYPSTESQRALGQMLADELAAMSVDGVVQDDHALVLATVPATVDGDIPTVALVAHMDTSPEAPGDNVNPQVIQRYDGGDITLPSGKVISADSTPSLSQLIGSTLITTDGTTLLGGDDKAGVAIIMELAATLIENPHLQHGPVRILFTCDEEIGHGTDKIDLAKVDATVAYTIDGGGRGTIDVETFSADSATVRFIGHNIHPSIGKGRMINATKAASEFVALLPRNRQTPETTQDREGFIHPHSIQGGVGEATVELILRSFETSDLEIYADLIRGAADQVVQQTPGIRVQVDINEQYRNMRDGLVDFPEAVSIAEQAFDELGRDCKREIIRGGTDGSQLTEKGLPTPNLSSGQHNIHSVTEFACLDEMVEATEHLVRMLSIWANQKS